MNLIAKSLVHTLSKYKDIFVAFSGGADSTALLHSLASEPGIHPKITALHINHGIQKESDLWQQHCIHFCESLDVRINTEKLRLKSDSEESCRNARYSVFRQKMHKEAVLLTAHHQQDQFETLLMRMFRGTGVAGLRGILSKQSFSSGILLRPMLSHNKDTVISYLKSHSLTWIEDPSNSNNRYSRNFIRNELTAKILQQWPQALDSVSRLAENADSTHQLVSHLLNMNKQKSLSVETLSDLPLDLRATALYHWLSNKNLPLPSNKALKVIAMDFCTENPNAIPKFETQNYVLMVWKNRIYCTQNIPSPDRTFTQDWDTTRPFEFPGGCGKILCHDKEPMTLQVRYSQSSEKIDLPNHTIRKSVKNIFQEQSVPPWMRGVIPFIYQKGKLVHMGLPKKYCVVENPMFSIEMDDLEL